METDNKKLRGKVVWFDSKLGFGFVAVEGQKDLFCHYSNITGEGFKSLQPEQEVEFELGQNHRGPQAVNVRVVNG